MGGRRRHAAAGVLAAIGGTLLVACGATPVAQPPTGIDGMTIPTPSASPEDFVSGVDNPWFPLAPGTRWTYRLYRASGGTQLVTATVLPEPHPVAGIDTTAVRWQARQPGGRLRTLVVRWYAEDTAGNVWWFGQRVSPRARQVDGLDKRSWQAGRHGAQAGLQVSAHPRVGDGYANGYLPHVVETHSTVLSVDATVDLPKGEYEHTLSTRSLTPLAPTLQVQSYYATGIGLVAQQATRAVSTDLALVAVRRP